MGPSHGPSARSMIACTPDQLLPCLMSSDVDQIRGLFLHVSAHVYPSFVNGWFRARRDGTRPRRPVEGSWSRPRAVRGMLVRHMGVLSEQFYGLGLGGLVRGSHAVGLVCRRTGTEARYTGASKSLLVAYTRISRSGAVAQRASRSAQGQWGGECPARGRHRGDRRA